MEEEDNVKQVVVEELEVNSAPDVRVEAMIRYQLKLVPVERGGVDNGFNFLKEYVTDDSLRQDLAVDVSYGVLEDDVDALLLGIADDIGFADAEDKEKLLKSIKATLGVAPARQRKIYSVATYRDPADKKKTGVLSLAVRWGYIGIVTNRIGTKTTHDVAYLVYRLGAKMKAEKRSSMKRFFSVFFRPKEKRVDTATLQNDLSGYAPAMALHLMHKQKEVESINFVPPLGA